MAMKAGGQTMALKAKKYLSFWIAGDTKKEGNIGQQDPLSLSSKLRLTNQQERSLNDNVKEETKQTSTSDDGALRKRVWHVSESRRQTDQKLFQYVTSRIGKDRQPHKSEETSREDDEVGASRTPDCSI